MTAEDISVPYMGRKLYIVGWRNGIVQPYFWAFTKNNSNLLYIRLQSFFVLKL